MPYRAPAILAVTLLILLAVHYLILPADKTTADPIVFRQQSGEQVVSLELAPGDGRPAVKIQAQGETRPPNIAINSYQMTSPYAKTADRTAVSDVMNMLYRLNRVDALEATEANLSECGLKQPTLVMKVTTTHRSEPIAIRFGKPEGAKRDNYEYVYCALESEPRWIYHWFKGYYDALMEPADAWRTRQVVSFQPHLVNKIWIETRADPKMAFQKTELTLGDNRQWWLTAPYRDRAEPDRINLVFDILTQLRAEKYDRTVDPVALKLDQSPLKVYLFTVGSTQPVEVTVSAFTQVGTGSDQKPYAYVYVQGSDEAAWVDASRIRNDFPPNADVFRPRAVFFYPEESLEKIEIYGHNLGQVVLEKKIEVRPSKRPGQAPSRVIRWCLTDPPGLEEPANTPGREAQDRAIGEFVSHLRQGEILNWAGRSEMPDGDPKFTQPECRLKFTLAKSKDEKEEKVFYFETAPGGGAVCYLPLGPNRYERVDVQRLFVEALKRLEWNFIVRPVLELDAGSVKEIRLEHVGERIALVKTIDGWQSSAAGPTRKLSVENLQALLEKLRSLNAVLYLAKVGEKDAVTAARFGLEPPAWRVRLILDHGGKSEEHVLRVSEAFEGNQYNAKLEESSVVFQIAPEIVEMIQRLHVRPW